MANFNQQNNNQPNNYYQQSQVNNSNGYNPNGYYSNGYNSNTYNYNQAKPKPNRKRLGCLLSILSGLFLFIFWIASIPTGNKTAVDTPSTTKANHIVTISSEDSSRDVTTTVISQSETDTTTELVTTTTTTTTPVTTTTTTTTTSVTTTTTEVTTTTTTTEPTTTTTTTTQTQPIVRKYWINHDSKIVHSTSCYTIPDYKEDYWEYFENLDINWAEANGYRACKKCSPIWHN